MNKTFSIKKALSEAWNLTCKEWIVLVGFFLAYTIISVVLELIFSFSEIVNAIISCGLSVIVNAAMAHLTLQIVRGGTPSMKSFTDTLPLFLKVLVIGLLTALGTFIGLLLFIVPGVIFLARISCAIYVLIDNPSLSAIDAIKQSFNITEGHVWDVVGIILVSILILIVGLLALFVGVFFAAPLTAMLMAVAYTMFSAEYKTKLQEPSILTAE